MSPKPSSDHVALTRRERQIMDILYKRGKATASEVLGDLPGTPHYSTVRTQLRVLEEKGHVTHEEDGVRYVYMPATPRRAARKSALRHLVDTFFDGSAEQVVAAVLGGEGARLSDEELDRIARAHRKSEERRKPMKMSLIVFGALAVSFLLRRRSAALRHWVLATGVACAALVPVLTAVVPEWPLPFAAPTAFSRYEDPFQESASPASQPSRAAATPSAAGGARVAGDADARTEFVGLRAGHLARRSGCWPLDSADWPAAACVARRSCPSNHARPLARSRRGDIAQLWTSASGDAARELSSVAARHVGARTAEGHSAGRSCSLDATSARELC